MLEVWFTVGSIVNWFNVGSMVYCRKYGLILEVWFNVGSMV